MKRGKKILALALCVSTIFGVSACGEKKQEDKNASGDAERTYLIATDTTFAPFEFEDKDGNFVGIDMDILKAVAEDQGFQYELQILGFNAALQSMEAKQSDGMIAGMSITDDRKKKFDFSEPYFDSGVVMGVAATDEKIKGYEDLRGKKVAIKTGTEGAAFAESIREQYGFEVVYFDDSATLYEDVKLGNTVACFEDYPVLGYAITQNVGLKMVTDKEQGSSYGFAVSRGENAELLQMFNEGLKNIKENGKYQEILDKYIQG